MGFQMFNHDCFQNFRTRRIRMALKDPEGTFKWSKMQKLVEVIGRERTKRQQKVLAKFFMEITRSSLEVFLCFMYV